MARKRTGLRNRCRSGRSSYSKYNKSARRDQYGQYNQGRTQLPESVAGQAYGYGYPVPGRLRPQHVQARVQLLSSVSLHLDELDGNDSYNYPPS